MIVTQGYLESAAGVGTDTFALAKIASGESWPSPVITNAAVNATLALAKIASAESWPNPAIENRLKALALTKIASGESWPSPRIFEAATNTLTLTKIASGESWKGVGINNRTVAATWAVKLAGVVEMRRLRAKVRIIGGTTDDILDSDPPPGCSISVSSHDLGTLALHATTTFDVTVPGSTGLTYTISGVNQSISGPSNGSGTVTVGNEDVSGSPGETITITVTPACDPSLVQTITYVRGA